MLEKEALKWLTLIPFIFGIGFNVQAMCQPNTKEKTIDLIKTQTKYADCIVIGKVVKIEPHPEGSRHSYHSWAYIVVEEYLKEEQDTSGVEQDTILIKTVGGLINLETGECVDFSGTPKGPLSLEQKEIIDAFGAREPTLTKISERVVLFLTRTSYWLSIGNIDAPRKAKDYFEILTYYRIIDDKVWDWFPHEYVTNTAELKDIIISTVKEEIEKFGGKK